MTLHSMSRFDTASDCFKHCGNPVIGECAGYRGGCGQLYCSFHSQNGLCAACVAAFFDEKTRLYRQWAANPGRLVAPAWAAAAALAIAGCSLANLLLIMPAFPGLAPLGWAVNLACALIAGLLSLRIYRALRGANERFQRQQAADPAFASFREQWRPDQSPDESAAIVRQLLPPAPAAP